MYTLQVGYKEIIRKVLARNEREVIKIIKCNGKEKKNLFLCLDGNTFPLISSYFSHTILIFEYSVFFINYYKLLKKKNASNIDLRGATIILKNHYNIHLYMMYSKNN